MPFDASGNFTRSYNFVQDAANGIKILAARVDGEFDNLATGMNLVFFRDGRVPMQADLRMNINGITGLKDGALGSPALKFNTDPNTGVYLPGLNQYGIQVNSVQRGVFTTAGFDVTGNLTASGTISQGGVAVATQAYVAGLAYAPLASPALTGTPTAPTAAAGNNGTQIATTAFVAASFAPLASPALTGTPTAPTAAGGTNTTQLATTAFVAASFAPLASPALTGTPTAPTAAVTTNTTQLATTAFVQAHSVALSGSTMTGNLTAPVFLTSGAGGGVLFNPRDGTTTQKPVIYSPTTGQMNLYNGSADILTLNGTGISVTGAIAGSSTLTVTGNVSSNGARIPNCTVSAAGPSGGQNGDTWFQL